MWEFLLQTAAPGESCASQRHLRKMEFCFSKNHHKDFICIVEEVYTHSPISPCSSYFFSPVHVPSPFGFPQSGHLCAGLCPQMLVAKWEPKWNLGMLSVGVLLPSTGSFSPVRDSTCCLTTFQVKSNAVYPCRFSIPCVSKAPVLGPSEK